MDLKNKMAPRTHEVEWSGIRVMFAMADEIDGVVNLGIGQPDFDTPVHIREAAKKALDEGFTRYPPAKGFRDLRDAIAKKLKAKNGITADPASEIFVAVGAMQVIFNTMLHLVSPGEEVIVIDPGYDYYSQIRLFGGVPVRVPVREENGFKLDPADVRKAVTDKTKVMILNTPGNPTGAMFDEAELKALAEIARERGIFVLSDEPYEDIIFDGRKHVSIGALPEMKELTISAYTLSKTYAMTGWRVGYAVAPKPIVDEMEKLMEHMVSGVTAPAQRAALAAITGSQEPVAEMLAAYEGLNAIDGISCLEPESTFYAFPNIKGLGMTSWDVAKFLVREHKVALVPGSIFGDNGEGYLRLSFAASAEQLEEGLRRIAAGAKEILSR
jgi:aspartate/methionine/tyrosine aminotransferase